jgi:hypothetical protein
MMAEAVIQWQGTNVCMAFNCTCGTSCHFDGYFAYTVRCPHCATIWEMPTTIVPRKADDATPAYWRENPKDLEQDDEL